MTLAESIRQARAAKNMTQKEAASALGISQQAYSQYESGKRRPKMDTIVKIADALGVQPQELIHDEVIELYNRTIYNLPEGRFPVEKAIAAAKATEEFVTMADDLEQSIRKNELEKIFLSLNEAGQLTALERLRELSEIPRYQAAKTGIPDPIPAGSKQDEPAPDNSSDGSPKDKV